MIPTYIEQSGMKLFVRTERSYQDIKVAEEVMQMDTYELEQLSLGLERPPKVILDIGGHIGTFGLMCKKHWPKCHIIAIEALKDNAELYRMNMQENGFDNVTVINKALVHKVGEKVLALGARTTGGAHLTDKATADMYIDAHFREYNNVEEEIEQTTLEEIFKKWKLKKVDLTKWDCEGAEIDIWKHMTPEVTRRFRFMCGEVHIQGLHYLSDVTPVDIKKFWRMARRAFPHLDFSHDSDPLTEFQAWPNGK